MSKRGSQRHRKERQEREAEKKLGAMMPAMPAEEMRALDAVAEMVERRVGVDESRQPRFTDARNLFTSVVRWSSYCSAYEPGARASMQEWDRWYRDFVCLEPFLAGCLASAVQIDKNRGWTLTGGRNQVAQYTKRLHGFQADVTGIGWRPHIEWLSQAFYTTMMGWVGEVGSQGKNGPLSMMWAVDPCRCVLNGNAENPLVYYPRMGGQQEWIYGQDFLRGCSQKQTSEDKLGYGFPAVARCYTLGKIMAGVYRHYQMKTGIMTPDGVLAHNAMNDEQWQKALEVREQNLRANPDNYLNSIIAVGNPGGEVPQFVMTILSGLPESFNIETWTLILMRGYQLAFGYGAGEFYPEQYSVIGRGKEQEAQHRSSTGKGGKDFSLTHQEQLQTRLPATLEFAYEERDVTGEIEDAQLQQAKAAVITEINKWVIESGGTKTSVLTTDQIMQLAAEAGVVPEEWTPQEEEVTSTDEETPDSERVQRAMKAFPDEPIVRYSSTTGKTRVLFNPVRRVFYMPTVFRSVNQVLVEYRSQLTNFVYEAWNGRMTAVDLRRAHREMIRALGPQSYSEGLREGGVDPAEMDESDQAAITEWISGQLAYVNDFATSAVDAGKDTDKRAAIISRLGLWIDSMRDLGNLGMLSAQKNAMLTFDGPDGAESCRDCQRMKTQRHRAKWWVSRGLVPSRGNPNYECGNWEGCHHFLRDDKGNRFAI